MTVKVGVISSTSGSSAFKSVTVMIDKEHWHLVWLSSVDCQFCTFNPDLFITFQWL